MPFDLDLNVIAVLFLLLAVSAIGYGMLQTIREDKVGARLRNAVGRQPGQLQALRTQPGKQQLVRMGQLLLGSGEAAEATAKLLRQANIWSRNAAPLFAISRLLLALVSCVGMYLWMRPSTYALSFGILSGLGAAVVMSKILTGYAGGRANKMRSEMPSAIGLMVLGLEGGAGVEHALRFAAEQSEAPTPTLSRGLSTLVRELDGGTPHDIALQRLADRLSIDEARTVTDLIRQSLQFGTELIVPLRALATDLAEQRLHRGREQVGKASVKMTIVMIMAFLPALLILMGAPAFSNLLVGLSRMSR